VTAMLEKNYVVTLQYTAATIKVTNIADTKFRANNVSADLADNFVHNAV
jgi:hypothetical protein